MTLEAAAALVRRVKHLEPRIRCDIQNVADTEDHHSYDVALWFPGPGSAQTISDYPHTNLRVLLEQVKGSPV